MEEACILEAGVGYAVLLYARARRFLAESDLVRQILQ